MKVAEDKAGVLSAKCDRAPCGWVAYAVYDIVGREPSPKRSREAQLRDLTQAWHDHLLRTHEGRLGDASAWERSA